MKMATVLFFEEDEVAMYSEDTGYRCGIVTESSEYFSSDEDDESEYETYERLRKGTVRIAWHPDGKSEVLKESELKLADRSLMPGDVIRRFIKGEDSQRGSVTATRIKCHLQVIGKPFIICNVDTRDVQPLSMFTTHSGDVHLDSWVGRLVNIVDRVTLRFNDGARCEVSDEETMDLLLDFKDAFEKQPKDSAFATMTFFEGQLLKGELGSLQDAKWLKNTKSFNKTSARKFHHREVVVTVEKVETFQLEINWICRGYSSHQEMTPTAMQPPPRIIKGESIAKVRHLDCFDASNYQIGDRAFYKLKETDKLVVLNPKDRHSAIHRVIHSGNNSSMDSIVSIIADNETDKTTSDDVIRGASANEKKSEADEETASESNLEKKDSQELVESDTAQSDSNTMVPDESANASAAETSALQTKAPAEKKAKTGVKRSAAQVKQLRKKKLKPTKVKPQTVNLDVSPPTPGEQIPIELIYTATVVDVTWQDGTKEVDISSTDLFPIHHLDDLEFFPGDYVASNTEIQMYDVYGVVQSVDHRGRTCKIKWLSHNNSSSVDTVVKVEEVSVYDIKDHPDLKFRPGHVVVRVGAEEQKLTNEEVSDASNTVRPIGQVFELCSDGQMVIQWDDGSKSCCYPMQLYLVGDETTDLGDSDSEDSYVSEDESSSDESCEWETEEEEWGPVEEGVSVESVVEWPVSACSSMKLFSIVTNLKDVTKNIEDLVSSMPTKGSTQTSSKFFRQLMQFFRVCREFDQAAGTKFFENEELVAMMAEIKKLNRKTKSSSQHHSKQVTDGSESNIKDSETDKSSKPAQRNASLSRDESGNDSGLEKSPSGSELREIEPTNASQSIVSLRILPSESSSGISQGLESTVDVQELVASRDAVKTESSSDGAMAIVPAAVAIVPAVDVATKDDDGAAGKGEVTVYVESSVMYLATTLTKLCRELLTLSKVWLNSEMESGKLCIAALQLLGQVVASNAENISIVIRSFESTPVCDSSTSQPRETGSEANKAETVSTQTGSVESVSCPADTALPVDTIATSNGPSEGVMSTPVKAALALKFDELQSVAEEEADAVSKTPATPAEIRAKVEFNPEGFTLVDSAPEFHHFKDQKHTPVDAKSFTSTIRKEMKLLHSCLPNGIYVKGFESRMDLFSIMIEGPSRTPYEDGLFFFDVQLPNNYPSSPPIFFYISYCTERLNPNLYEDGKVCVSLLGTWTGKGTEMWHSKSNLLQVLISIQGLILNPEPYYNEAGYERQKGTQLGLENSRMYNEMAILKMVQSMTKLAVNPFKTFSSEIRLHLMDRAYKMINRLRHWISATEGLSPKMLPTKTDESASEASSLLNPPPSTNESTQPDAEAAADVVSSHPSNPSDSKASSYESNGIDNDDDSPATGSDECVLIDVLENSDDKNVVDIDVTTEEHVASSNPNNLHASSSDTSSQPPRSQSSAEALCSSVLDDGAAAASLPAFPLLPISKGFRISLSKCLDGFESILTSVGVSPTTTDGCCQ